MASPQVFVSSIFTFLFLLPQTTSSAVICETSSCGSDSSENPPVKFPYRLKGTNADQSCGYMGFDISCNNQSQTILTLPRYGDVVVECIDYYEQSIYIADPDDHCFARRSLDNFTLSGSPSQFLDDENFTFSNCSDNVTMIIYGPYAQAIIGCFQGLSAPSSNGGLPRSAKYGIIIGVGIPGLLCLIGLSCYLCGRIRVYRRRRNNPNTELTSINISPQRSVLAMGLDGPTIESYPKTLLGESRRLPKPSDNTCPICLSEYQPKEELRTIPECNHYFHVNCIDEWLKLNGTCPLCRNSPDGSALVTPSSLSSFSSTSLSSQ